MNKFFVSLEFFSSCNSNFHEKSKWQNEVSPCNPNFHDPVVGASKNHHKWNLKFDIQMDSHSIVGTINYKTDLKFCLTIATKRSHKDK